MKNKSDTTKKKKQKITINPDWEQINPDAAGIDIGSREHWACVPPNRQPQNVRKFGTFTGELEALADWFEQCGVKTVAMEATGVYWIPVFQILERRGFKVVLVNPRQTKNVAGRKSDVQDCQWIQRLHTYGLLQASFRPSDAYCALRTCLRYRDELITARGTQRAGCWMNCARTTAMTGSMRSNCCGVACRFPVVGRGPARSATGVLTATRAVEARLPFALLGFDSDNGGEFLNHHLWAYLRERKEAVEFTRSRPYHSDDNAHVEQKNWTWARQLLGYGRLEDPDLVEPISALYRDVWAPWQNFFLPCLKLEQKWREGSHWRKRYEEPRTAYPARVATIRFVRAEKFIRPFTCGFI